jgi:hypothetical protein
MREHDFDYFYREQIPDQDGITAYQDNRALLLDKVLRDHDQLEQAFGQSLARHPECPGFAVQSYDRYGDPQEILIVDAMFLEGHLKIAESLMKDLWVTGERGAAIVQEVVFDDRPIASLRITEIGRGARWLPAPRQDDSATGWAWPPPR